MADRLLKMMLETQQRPTQEAFDCVIEAYASSRDAAKVEEWLLAAGNQGWTPRSEAFENVVLLFAEANARKAEEWLSRVKHTEYRLPDVCYDDVIQAFAREGDASSAHEWLLRMIHEQRAPRRETLEAVTSSFIACDDLAAAENWLTELARGEEPSELRKRLFGRALRSDLALAERHVAGDDQRLCQLLAALGERAAPGDADRIADLLRGKNGSMSGAILAAAKTAHESCGGDNAELACLLESLPRGDRETPPGVESVTEKQMDMPAERPADKGRPQRPAANPERSRADRARRPAEAPSRPEVERSAKEKADKPSEAEAKLDARRAGRGRKSSPNRHEARPAHKAASRPAHRRPGDAPKR